MGKSRVSGANLSPSILASRAHKPTKFRTQKLYRLQSPVYPATETKPGEAACSSTAHGKMWMVSEHRTWPTRLSSRMLSANSQTTAMSLSDPCVGLILSEAELRGLVCAKWGFNMLSSTLSSTSLLHVKFQLWVSLELYEFPSSHLSNHKLNPLNFPCRWANLQIKKSN